MKLSEAKALALKLFSEHNLDWTFQFDNAHRRFGVCRYRSRIISISRSLTELNDESKVRDTLLHEIAHAIVGMGTKHGRVWQLKAREIGCNGSRCYKEREVNLGEAPWIGSCPFGHEISRFKRSRRISCARCNPRFDEKYLITWKHK